MLDPQVSAFLGALPEDVTPTERLTPDEARAIVSWAGLTAELPSPKGEDVELRCYDTTVPARLYRGDDRAMPTILYLHGGAWVVGTVDDYDNVCRGIALLTGSIVVSVDYRLAPEHPFPAAVNDCYAAATAITDNASLYDVNSQLGLMGDSAGGNLAASVALMARDRGHFKPAFQVLIYPVLDFNPNSRSMLQFAEGYSLTRAAMIWAYDHYCTEADRTDPYAAPLRATSLSSLPPTLILTADYDPLRDEGEAYARRLSMAGVPTTLSCYSGQIHGFFVMTAHFSRAWSAQVEVATFMRSQSRRTAIRSELLMSAQTSSLLAKA